MSAWHRSLVFAILGMLLISGLSSVIGNNAVALPTSTPLWTATQPANWGPQSAVTKDGRYVAYTNSEEATLSLYDTYDRSGEPLWTRTFEGPATSAPIPLAFSGDGTCVSVGTRLNNVMTYSVPSGALLWTTNLNATIYSLAVDLDGSDTYVGMPNMVDKLDENGVFEANYYKDVGGAVFAVDTNDDGNMVLATCPVFIVILDESLGELNSEVASGFTFYPGKVADGRTTAVWLQSDGVLGMFSLYIGGDASYFIMIHRDLRVGIPGDGSLDVSDDASTAFGMVGDIIFMYDLNTASPLWETTTQPFFLHGAYLSSDGTLGMLGGLGFGTTIFGRENNIPLQHLDRFDLLTYAMSGNGATAITGNHTELSIYRSALDISVEAQGGASYFGQEVVLIVNVEADGIPVLGADIAPSFSASGVTYTITDLGDGLYQLAILKASGPSPLTLQVDITVAADGQQPAATHALIVLQKDPFAELSDQITASESNLSAQMTMMWAALSTQVRTSEGNLSAQMTALGASLTAQLTSLGNSVTTIQDSVNGLGSAWASTDAKVTSIQNSLIVLSANVSYIRTTVDDIYNALTLTNSRLVTLQNSVNTINTACTNMQSSLAALTTSMAALRAQVNGIDASLAGVAAQIGAMYNSINATIGSISALQVSIDRANAALVQVQTDLNTDYANLTSSMQSLNTAIGANFTVLRAEVAAVSAQVQVVNGNITAVSTQLGTVSAAVGVIEGNTEDLKGKSDSSTLFGVLGMVVTIIMGLLILFYVTRKKKFGP
jgi:prefoldin subunit 5